MFKQGLKKKVILKMDVKMIKMMYILFCYYGKGFK